MDSTYYKNLIHKYENIINSVQSVLGYFSGCYDSMKMASGYMKELIINDDEFDNGKIDEENSKLQIVENDLRKIVVECKNKVSQCTALYNTAYAEEHGESVSDNKVMNWKTSSDSNEK